MKKFIPVLSILFILLACSKDDTNQQNAEGAQTFLERVDGQGFVFTQTYGEDYFYFSNSSAFLKVIDVENDYTKCSELEEGSILLYGDEGEVRIVTNTYDALLIEIDWRDVGLEQFEFTLNDTGNILKVSYPSSSDSVSSVDFDNYIKTGRKVSEFNCQ